MPIVSCSECNGKVATDALACPHCGHPMKAGGHASPPTQVPAQIEIRGQLTGGSPLGNALAKVILVIVLILMFGGSCAYIFGRR